VTEDNKTNYIYLSRGGFSYYIIPWLITGMGRQVSVTEVHKQKWNCREHGLEVKFCDGTSDCSFFITQLEGRM